jgi:putative transposase
VFAARPAAIYALLTANGNAEVKAAGKKRTDTLYLIDPCSSSSSRMVDYVARDEISIDSDRARNLMQRMRLPAISQIPQTTIPGSTSMRNPCLLDLSQVRSVDQGRATDNTYIPLQKKFVYLEATVDLFSKHVLSWKHANSLEWNFAWRPWK